MAMSGERLMLVASSLHRPGVVHCGAIAPDASTPTRARNPSRTEAESGSEWCRLRPAGVKGYSNRNWRLGARRVSRPDRLTLEDPRMDANRFDAVSRALQTDS